MLNNYEFVQKGFRILHPLMLNYIGQEFQRAYGNGSWQEILDALSDQQGLPETGVYEEKLAALDIMNCLRLLDRRWNEVFRLKLSIDHRSWAKELMGVRNKAAHIGVEDFPKNYAERALDTMALICGAFDAEGVEKIRSLYRTLRYGSEEGSVAFNAQPSQRTTTTLNEGVDRRTHDLPSWREVMQPHPDVAEGRYRTAEFAADLSQVARGEGEIEYRDPVEFFNRTYITEGMARLLVGALQRLSRQGGEPVIQLKTAFGGGKTHSMLALYHLVRGGFSIGNIPSLRPILERAHVTTLPRANVAVLVGTSLDPARKKNPSNLPKYAVNTLWGEMAYQLVTAAGKPELYALVADADRRGVSPGSETLKKLFDSCGTCLILMDELVAYARNLRDGLPAGNLESFITFIQALTEAVRASKDCIVVASIPESDTEIGGDRGKKALEAIEHTFGRMEAVWKPVVADEGFEIVRRRLFLECRDKETRNRICSAFSNMYQENSNDFPIETKEVGYRDRMIACYPIHPEIFDRLYEDWSTLERFQRTRGVLRLMATVIHELWVAGDAGAMIMPGSIPLNSANVRDELVRHLPDTWNSIIDREVDGRGSIPFQKDSSNPRYGAKFAARRVARTIMLGSAPSTAALRNQKPRGLEASRIRLGVVRPGENISVFNDALNTLQGALSYLYTNQNGTRFWYDTKPTLRKTAEDRASQVSDADVTMELERRLKGARKENYFSGLHICPTSSNDIVDEQAARLVILRPEDSLRWSNGKGSGQAMEKAETYLNTRGTAPRIYRNMLTFIAPDQDKLRNLQNEAKRYIAWKSILDDKIDLNLDGGQVREAEANLSRCNSAVEAQIKETYCWSLVPYIDPEVDIGSIQWQINNLGGGDESIVAKAAKRAKQDEQLITDWAPALLRMCLDEPLWKNADHIEIKKLWEHLCTYCYLPRLAGYSVLEEAIRRGAPSTEYFAIAAGYSDGRYLDLRLNENVQFINKSDLLVRPEVARKQIEEERKAQEGTGTGNTAPVGGTCGGRQEGTKSGIGGGNGDAQAPQPPKKTRFYMSAKLDYIRANKEVDDCINEIIRHLADVDGAKVELSLEVNVDVANGIPAATVRTVSENCRTLKIKDFGFEER